MAATMAIALAAGLGGCHCGSGPGPAEDAGDGGAPDGRADAGPGLDAATDASFRDGWVDASPCVHAHEGWLVYRQQLRQSYIGYDEVFAVNLVAEGILDDQGRVIPE